MALLDPRQLEIEILSEADRKTFLDGSGKFYQYSHPSTMSQEDQQRDAALLELMGDRAIVSADSYSPDMHSDPEFAVKQNASWAVSKLLRQSSEIINLRITQGGRLRLFRLRDEILSGRDRIRDDFGVLWARRHWLPDLAVHLSSRLPGTPVSLIVLDVDKLKDLNDDLGHHGADKVLIGIFEELRDAVRPQEGYRIGMGDEAGAVLVGVALDEAAEIGEQIRRRVETRDWPGLKFRRPPTVSIGVGTLTQEMAPEAFYAAVDALAIVAKKDRNKVGAAMVSASVS